MAWSNSAPTNLLAAGVRRWPGGSLAAKFAAVIVLTTLLAGAGTGAVAMQSARTTVRDEILAHSLGSADLAADLAANYVVGAEAAARELADRPAMRETIARSAFIQATPDLEHFLAGHLGMANVSLVDLNGTVRATGSADKSGVGHVNSADRDWFREVVHTGQPYLGEAGVGRVYSYPRVPYGVPLLDEAGQLQGVMVASISLDELTNTIVHVDVGPNARTTLIDLEHGITLAHVDPTRILQQMTGTNAASMRLLKGERGTMENVTSRGEATLAAYTPVPGLPWGVLIQQPSPDAFAPVDAMVGRTAELVSVELLLAGAIGVGLALSIGRPLRRLRHQAEAMASGDLTRRTAIRRRDEIGELGRAFDAMADQLADTIGRLEEDIQARQRIEEELREGQERFRAIFDNAPVGINVFSTTGYTIQANRAMQRMVGYTLEELRQRTFSDYTHPDDHARDRERLQEMLVDAPLPVYRREKRYIHKSGETVWVHITSACVADPDGRPRFFITMTENVSERKRAEAALMGSERRNQAILDAALDGIFSMDADGRVTEFNPAAERMFGRSRVDMLACEVTEIIDLSPGGLDRPASLVAALAGQCVETTGRRADGATFPVELAMAAVTVGSRREFTGHVRDISARKRVEAALAHQALHDALTGLPNRTLLRDRLEQAVLTAERQRRPFALLLLDLDRFKDVNDTLGHHAGDWLLQEVSRRLQVPLRNSDTVARLGGDEFAALLPDTDRAGAALVAGKLVQALDEPFVLDAYEVSVGASIGIALHPEHGGDAETLLRRADVAMYAAKQERRTHVVYAPDQDRQSSDRLALVGALRRAIAQDELVLHYQPKIDCRSGALVGVEALVRWQHPQNGLIPPDRFIPLAEQTGLIKPLTRWALDNALRQCRAWRDAGSQIPVAVNISAHDVQNPELPELLTELLHRWAVPAAYLKLELTESALVANPARALTVLTQLAEAGVRVAVDDFGTGYSSLAYLKRLPIHEIKIDRSFVRDMVADTDDQAIVRSTIELGHNLGLAVVAEGVEDEATLELLQALGCDVAQGYHLGRPLPAAEMVRWCATRDHDEPDGLPAAA